MGILASIFDEREHPDEVERAFIHTVCLAVWSDDELTTEEHAYAVSCISDLLDADEETSAECVEQTFASIEEEGFEEVMQWVADELDDVEDRERAFMLAIGALYVDGEVAWDEEEFLVSFAMHLGIDEDRAEELVGQFEDGYNDLI